MTIKIKIKKGMNKHVGFIIYTSLVIILGMSSCAPKLNLYNENRNVPDAFTKTNGDSTNIAKLNYKVYFDDPYLAALIDSALMKNQELKIMQQEIAIANNEILEKSGEYKPFVNLGAKIESEKVGRFTRNGAVERNLEIKEGTEFPEPLSNIFIGASASWEIDAWKKLRNTKKAAISRYLASTEGVNFMKTNLVSEISSSYYELVVQDNLLNILNTNIAIQTEAAKVIRQRQFAGQETMLAVNRFEAQLLNTQNLKYEILQKIAETENRINFLCGKFTGPILRTNFNLDSIALFNYNAGLPSQLLSNRPDIRQKELLLEASKLDVMSARARFLPSFSLSANLGIEAYNPRFIFNPESILLGLAGDALSPLVNKNAIKAMYATANNRQIAAVTEYEQSILKAYIDVRNQLIKYDNFTNSYTIKSKEVALLNESVQVANKLFNAARADYTEVLLTQEEALDSKMEMIEIKLKQLLTKVDIYRALGGGWQ